MLRAIVASNTLRCVIRRIVTFALAFLLLISAYGPACAGLPGFNTTACCGAGCASAGQSAKALHCCQTASGQSAQEVVPVHNFAPDHFQRTISSGIAVSVPHLQADRWAFTEVHAPPGLAPSPENLCCLQI